MSDKAKSHRAAAAGILAADRDWLEVLTLAIETQRDGAIPSIKMSSDRLALLVAHFITKPRHDDRAPYPLEIAQEIGAAILSHGPDAVTRADEHIGDKILGMAVFAGFAEIVPVRLKSVRLRNEVRLSPAAEADLSRITEHLMKSDVGDNRPSLEPPPLELKIIPNKNDFDAPPYPADPLAIAEALAPIQGTAWHVNGYMLDVLQKLRHLPEIKAHAAAIAQAAHYRDAPRFYYRCNFDWRGRLYQHGGKLQYTSGHDVARSLLEFADGHKLTAEGRTWLGVHVATCYGIKGSLTDRMVWTCNHEHDIRAAVADPIGFLGWWGGADEPCAFLAACHAWVNQHDPVHLPVSADGTASGFQHFAWLLRNEALGRLVNLGPGPLKKAPIDFYQYLAGELGYWNKPGTPDHDQPVTRQDVKPVAWMIYGKRPKNRREEDIMPALRSVPVLAPVWGLYDALRATARGEAKEGRAIEWTLPDGFRVRQARYREESRITELYLPLNGPGAKMKRLQAKRRTLLKTLSPPKQADGLPPNLIHSFDACLLRTVVRQATTIDAWAVAHDSLGVHPNQHGELRQAVQRAVAWLYGPDRLVDLQWLDGGAVERVPDLPASMAGGWYTFS